MGYLDKSTITVDAILTNRGRELLAKGTGTGNFEITKFSVADDEVDYGLYNTAHPLGSNYYGAIIENMPVLEATPDDTQIMRYKLVTVSGTDAEGTVVIPQITGIGYTSQTLYYAPVSGQQKELTIRPVTTYVTGGTGTAESLGYTLTLADASLATVEIVTPLAGKSVAGVVPVNNRGSIVALGTVFKLTSKQKTGTTSVTVYGGATGAVYNFTLSTVA
jgi:hypothetical protein